MTEISINGRERVKKLVFRHNKKGSSPVFTVPSTIYYANNMEGKDKSHLP